MNHSTRTSKTGSTALRIGIVQRGHLIEERKIDDCDRITIGQSPRNLFTVLAEGLPRTYQMFHRCRGRQVLRFAPGMDGRITVDGRLWTLAQAMDAGVARRVGDWYELPLDPEARGKLSLGEVTVLFQQIELAPVVPMPRLPASLQGGIGSRMDPAFSMVLSGSLALAAAFLIAVQLVPKPTGVVRSSRIRSLLNNQTRIERNVTRPKPAAVVSKPVKGDPGDDPNAKVLVRTPTSKHVTNGRTPTNKPAAKFKKGTQEYRDALASLTDVAPTDGRITRIVLAGQCKTEAECKRAIAATDLLRNGASIGRDLDDRAQRPGGIGNNRPDGPSSHTTRPGLAHNGGKPVVTGTHTNPVSPTTKPKPKPRTLKSPKGTHRFQPPKVRPKGGASISAKVRSRVYSLRYCYNRLLPSHPTLKGTVRISFVVMPNGRVKSVNVSTGMGGSMKSCVRSTVARWTLGKPKISGPVYYGPFSVKFHARN